MPPRQEQPLSDSRQGMALMLWLAETMSVFPAVFLHAVGTWGTRYPVPAVLLPALAAPLLAFSCVAAPESGPSPRAPAGRTQDAEAFLLLWVAWLIGFLLHKACASDRENSYYDGTPMLCGRSGRGEIAVKRFLEPLLCIGFGLLMQARALPAFGSFWMLCGVSYALSMGLAMLRWNQWIRDQLDAEQMAAQRQAWADRRRRQF